VLEKCLRKLNEFDRVFNVRLLPDFLCSNDPTMDLTCGCVVVLSNGEYGRQVESHGHSNSIQVRG
jgi:hypothetical protein